MMDTASAVVSGVGTGRNAHTVHLEVVRLVEDTVSKTAGGDEPLGGSIPSASAGKLWHSRANRETHNFQPTHRPSVCSPVPNGPLPHGTRSFVAAVR